MPSTNLVVNTKAQPVEYALRTPDRWLQQAVNHLEEANDAPGDNTDYNGPDIDLEDMSIWKDFPTAQDIQSQLSAATREKLRCAFTQQQLDKLTWGVPIKYQ